MRLCSIASGSSGNCIYVGSDNTHVLVDAGISGKRIEQGLSGLQISGKDLDAILVTHEHTDHIQGLGVMARRYNVPLYMTGGTIFVVFLGDFSVLLHNDICENIMGINTENMTILRLLTPFLILLMMAIVQVNVSILLSPVTANLIMVIYMVCSVYYSNNFFVYNYCMYSRIFSDSADNIIALVTALIFSLLVLIISSVLALKKSSRIDIC